MNPRFVHQPATFAAGASVSDRILIENRAILELHFGTAWNAAQVTLQATRDGTTWLNVYDDSGSEVVIVAGANRLVRLSPNFPLGAAFVRLRAGTAASPSVQSTELTVGVTTREFA